MARQRVLPPQLARKIIDYIRERGLESGSHLAAQGLADMFDVSRIPVNTALKLLEEQGIVTSERNRGYFLAQDSESIAYTALEELPQAFWDDPLYYQLAEDWLHGRLSEKVSESELMRLYTVPRSRLLKVLQHAMEDMWVERLPGHGWRFLAVMISPQAYVDGYRFRMAIEPAALLEPTFKADKAALEKLVEQQIFLMKGGARQISRNELFTLTAGLHEVIVGFSNNPFFTEAVKKVNRVRRLLDFRSTLNRDRFPRQCREHLKLIELIDRGNMKTASAYLKTHLGGALNSKLGFIAGGS